MRAILYLSAVRLKNSLLDWLRRPARLITLLLFAALLLFSMLGARSSPLELRRPQAELGALILLLYAAVFIVSIWQGLQAGASFYSMADVHFLFSAPISPRQVLLYGLLRQAGSSLLIGFFLLYQYSWLHSLYGVSPDWLAVILIGYGFCIFCAQLTAMALYSLTSQSERARQGAKAALLSFCTLAALGLLPALSGGTKDFLPLAAERLDGLPFSLFPVAGWLKGAVSGYMSGSSLQQAGFLLLSAAYVAALCVLIMKLQPDFYEDVLLAAENAQSAITAKKEGRIQESLPRHIRLGKTGISRGTGAGVFYYKQRLEDRRSRFFMLDTLSVFFLVFNWGMTLFQRENGPIPLLIFSTYLQLFSTGGGRWARELLLPYVYLLPEPAAVKLFHICRESLLRAAVEAVILHLPAGLILGLSPAQMLGCIAFRMGFALLFLAGNILIERVLGGIHNRTVLMMLYFLILLLFCIPGVLLAVLLYATFENLVLSLAVSFLFNAAVSALIAFLCRDMLSYAELNQL